MLVGSATWATPAIIIGDMLELVGCRNNTTGASLDLDGPWQIANAATTNLTLVLPYSGQRTLPADFATTNCGGGLIRRTCFRLSFVRIFDYERERVEMLARPTGDMAAATPVVAQGGSLAGISVITLAGTPAVPATPYFVNSAATTNGALVLTGTSGLCALWASNIGATDAFVKLYNKATAPTVGTDVPEMIIPVRAAVAGLPGIAEISPGFNAYRFPLGLGIAITGAVADSDTTAVAAGQVKVKLSRTV